MGSYAEVVVLVEGATEQMFVKQLLAPYMASRGVYLTPIIIDKPGEKGGDVKFARARNDIGSILSNEKIPGLRFLLITTAYEVTGLDMLNRSRKRIM